MALFWNVLTKSSRISQTCNQILHPIVFSKPCLQHPVMQNTHRNLAISHCLLKNIKHKKSRADDAKSRMITALRRDVIIAIREGGSRDPDENWRLAAVLKRCKASGMPKATLERAMNVKDHEGETTIVLDCPEGIQIIVVCGTDKIKICKARLNKACAKFPWKVSSAPSSDYFEQQVIVRAESTKPLDEDSAMELALEVGADDVEVEENKQLKFICDPKNYSQTEMQLKSREDVQNISNETEYKAYGQLPVNSEVFDAFDKFLEHLDGIDSDHMYGFPVLQVFHNLKRIEQKS